MHGHDVIGHMARCTAPVEGHRSASAAAACPACRGRYGRYSGYSSYGSYPSPSSSAASGSKAHKALKSSSEDNPRGPVTVFQLCVILIGEQFFGGQKLGVSPDIETKLATQRNLEQYLGLFIDFPLASSNDDEGFGQCHTSKLPPLSPKA